MDPSTGGFAQNIVSNDVIMLQSTGSQLTVNLQSTVQPPLFGCSPHRHERIQWCHVLKPVQAEQNRQATVASATAAHRCPALLPKSRKSMYIYIYIYTIYVYIHIYTIYIYIYV